MGRSLSLAAYRALSRRKQSKAETDSRPPRPAGEVGWVHAPDFQRQSAVMDIAHRLEVLRPDTTMVVSVIGDVSDALRELADPLRDVVLPIQVLEADHPGAAARFLDHWRPGLCLWTGGELWINHISAAAERDIPMILADVDQSHLDSRRHKWFPELTRQALDCFDAILPNSTAAAMEMRRLGVDRSKISVVPRMRANPRPPACSDDELTALTEDLASRSVWLAAQAQPGEIDAVLAAHRSALRLSHRLLLVLQTAMPQEVSELDAKAKACGLRADHWDENGVVEDHTQVLISSDPEDLGLWYRVAPLAFLASSLEPGAPGIDPMNAAALGSAVLHGPNVGQHIESYSRLAAAGAARAVSDATSLSAALLELIAPDHAAAMSLAGWEVATEGAETTDRVIGLIEHHLGRQSAPDARS